MIWKFLGNKRTTIEDTLIAIPKELYFEPENPYFVVYLCTSNNRPHFPYIQTIPLSEFLDQPDLMTLEKEKGKPYYTTHLGKEGLRIPEELKFNCNLKKEEVTISKLGNFLEIWNSDYFNNFIRQSKILQPPNELKKAL